MWIYWIEHQEDGSTKFAVGYCVGEELLKEETYGCQEHARQACNFLNGGQHVIINDGRVNVYDHGCVSFLTGEPSDFTSAPTPPTSEAPNPDQTETDSPTARD